LNQKERKSPFGNVLEIWENLSILWRLTAKSPTKHPVIRKVKKLAYFIIKFLFIKPVTLLSKKAVLYSDSLSM
jgi:hypothetical protein